MTAESASWRRWWGGRLSDGTVVVLNPSGPPVAEVYDLTTGEDPPTWSPEPARGFLGWLDQRVPSIAGVTLPFAPIRRSLLLSALCLLVWTVIMVITTTAPLTTSILAMAALLVAIVLFAWSEGNPRRRGTLTSIPTDAASTPQDMIRYVPDAVSQTPEWNTLSSLADQTDEHDPHAGTLHQALWRATSLRVYHDTQKVVEEDRLALNQLTVAVVALFPSAPGSAN